MDEAKRELVQSWLRKAVHDLKAAGLLGKSDPPLLDAALYHCQEAAEKALKGFLVYFDQRAGQVHDVGLLLEQAGSIEPVLATWHDAADRLTPLAAMYRYPISWDEPLPEQFEEAYQDAETIVRQVLTFLPGVVRPEA